MIISRTPFRISLFGGSSDYPQWYEKHGGAVLGLALNRYCYINLRKLPPFFEYRSRIVYSKTELVKHLHEIEHPAVRGILQEHRVNYGIELHHDADLPARSGLGSSSSFTVGLLHALHAIEGRMRSKRQLAEEAIHIEQSIIRESVGSQDQIWAAYGGLNRIDFSPTAEAQAPNTAPDATGSPVADFSDGPLVDPQERAKLGHGTPRTRLAYRVDPLILPSERREALIGYLMLCFTGFSRIASEMASKQIANLEKHEAHIHRMVRAVDEAQKILTTPKLPLTHVGDLLHECWRLKRELANGVSNPQIDEIYQAGLDAGAIGGKLLGAGGGGFLLFFVHPAYHAELRDRLRKLITLPVGVDFEGSRILVYEPEN